MNRAYKDRCKMTGKKKIEGTTGGQMKITCKKKNNKRNVMGRKGNHVT